MTNPPAPGDRGPVVVPGSPPPNGTYPTSGGRIADVTVSVILLVAGTVGFAFLAFMSMFLVMMSDGCFADSCNTGLMTVGWLIALVAPPAVFLAAIVWTLIRIGRRRTAWWVPVAGGAVAVAVWAIGGGLMQAGLGR